MIFIERIEDNYKITLAKYYNDEDGKYGYNAISDSSYSVNKIIKI